MGLDLMMSGFVTVLDLIVFDSHIGLNPLMELVIMFDRIISYLGFFFKRLSDLHKNDRLFGIFIVFDSLIELNRLISSYLLGSCYNV